MHIDPNDSIAGLPFEQIKPNILSWLFIHNYKDYKRIKNRKPNTIHHTIQLQKVESGVTGITTFFYRETEESSSSLKTVDLHVFSSCRNDTGERLCLPDMVSVEKRDSVLNLIKECILQQKKDKDNNPNPELFSDILIETGVSIIDNHLHCSLHFNTPDDYDIDIPLHEIQDCLRLKFFFDYQPRHKKL